VAKFQPGQSGNPNGRPKKERALTDLLERAGNVVIEDGEGGRSARKRIVAALSWKLLTEGEATLPNGKRLVLAPAEWASLYKWIYTHIDGPAKAEIDVTTGGKPIEPKADDADRFDRAISTLADALREALPRESGEPDGAVGAAEPPAVAGTPEPGG
jgi:hypothetical protein